MRNDLTKISQERDSNIELLRLVAMFFILCHHFINNSLFDIQAGAHKELTTEYGVYSLLEGFLYVGVNCFLLISGYYGIKLRARKLWSMYLQLGFYGVSCYLIEALLFHKPITHTVFTKSIFILSHPCWWFVAYFLLLMFLSPWLNSAIRQMSKKQYQFALLGFTFVQIYLGWFWQKTCYDPNGYSILNFIYLYVIGGYIGRFCHKERIVSFRWGALTFYILCAIIWGMCNILKLYINVPFGNNYGYNNPVVLLAAVFLFMFFLSFSFQNRIVNWLASGAFAAYLITDTPYVGYHMYEQYHQVIDSMRLHLWQIISITTLSAAVVLMSCCCVDTLRAWMMKPLLSTFDWIDRKWNNGKVLDDEKVSYK